MDRWVRFITFVSALWPGLPQLWRHGSFWALARAMGFAFLLQLSVFTTLIWPETVGLASRAVVWFSVLGFWMVFAAPEFSRAAAIFAGGFSTVDREHLFIGAQREYLKGNWSQSERALRRLLEFDAGDVDSRFLLATLYRHVGNLRAASEQLSRLLESPGSDKWKFEVLQERLILARLRKAGRNRSDSNPNDLGGMATEAA